MGHDLQGAGGKKKLRSIKEREKMFGLNGDEFSRRHSEDIEKQNALVMTYMN